MGCTSSTDGDGIDPSLGTPSVPVGLQAADERPWLLGVDPCVEHFRLDLNLAPTLLHGLSEATTTSCIGTLEPWPQG